MAKHTPGPWKLHKTTKRGEFCWDYKIKSADNSAICTIGPVAQDANGALIAAAPDMLIALQTIALRASSLDVQGIRELCDAALAKARGEP